MLLTVDGLIDVIYIVGILGLTGMTMVSWMRNPRQESTRIVGSSNWLLSSGTSTKIVATIIGSLLGIFLGYLLWKPFVNVPSELALPLKFVGLVLSLVSGLFIVWARLTLGKNWSVSTMLGVQLQADHQLIQSGPFAMVRHPMYVGFWNLLLGALLAYRTWALLLLLPMVLASFYLRSRREEMALEAEFGEDWRHYAAHVGKFLPHPR